jgi:hypothetical protein
MATGLDQLPRAAASGGPATPWSEPAGGCAAVDALDPLHAGDCCYTFGGTVETSEHCNVFLYYWPKTADVTCF